MTEFNGFYRAKVVDNVDPLKAGRCKIRVMGVHTQTAASGKTDGIPDADLPFAEQAGIINGFVSTVPDIGSWVWCFFEQGDFQKPVYFASMPLRNSFDTSFNEGDMVVSLTGKMSVKNTSSDLLDILKDIQAILLNLVTTGNLIGNLGAPVVYSQVATDLPKATTLLTKLNNLLK